MTDYLISIEPLGGSYRAKVWYEYGPAGCGSLTDGYSAIPHFDRDGRRWYLCLTRVARSEARARRKAERWIERRNQESERHAADRERLRVAQEAARPYPQIERRRP